MKTLIIITLSIISFNSFSAQVGEDKKGECIYSDQSSKREKKVVETPVVSSESKDQTKSAISK